MEVICHRDFEVLEWRGDKPDAKFIGVIIKRFWRSGRKRNRRSGGEGTEQTDRQILDADK